MENFIKEMYYGNLEPQKNDNKEIDKAFKKVVEIKNELLKQLKNEDRILFEKYLEINSEFSSISDTQTFINGFRFGAKFLYDTFIY